MTQVPIHIIGAGLAGSEAAYFLAEHGYSVSLHEMRPARMTPAHKTALCAELVCSNSLKSKNPISAPGMLKAELRHLGSLILTTADEASVDAGEALAVDRHLFAESISAKIATHARITLVHNEVQKPFDGITLIATGPLTSDTLTHWLQEQTKRGLYFYDAIAPIVDTSSIDMNFAFIANRYDKGSDAAYINCPLSQDEYYAFIDALLQAEQVPLHAFEEAKYL